VGSRLLALVVLASLVAGCGTTARISSDQVKNLALTRNDLPGNFTPFAEGRTATLDTQGTSRADLHRLKRLDGWVARFRRVGAATGPGPLVIVSTVDVFQSSSGAKADLAAFGSDVDRQAADGLATRVPVRSLGDGAIGARIEGPGGGSAFLVAWRMRNATASVTASALARGLALRDVVQLARLQEAKFARAG
jgi:hypothetical protein